MAVYQISKIQIRRGQAGQGTGIPQLASGELAWAIDTQELYIGNGSVAEGAPAVGNTKILTSNDLSVNGSLLGVLQYSYKTTDPSVITGTNANNPVYRTMQSKLDSSVSVNDFGAVGDAQLVDSNDITSGYTGTDNTLAIQRAINQCFLNTSLVAASNNGAQQRITLKIPAGVYVITDTIYIPSYANIEGDGLDNTIIYYNSASTIGGTVTALSTTLVYPSASTRLVGASISGTGIPAGTTIVSVVPGVSVTLSTAATGSGTFTFNVIYAAPAFKTINSSSTIGTTPSTVIVNPSSTNGLNQPRNIHLEGLTVITASGQNTAIQLDSARSSYFSNIKLEGNWGNSTNNLSRGLFLSAASHTITCENNHFNDIRINSFSYGINSYQDILNNQFQDLHFTNCYKGITLGFNTQTQQISSGSVGSDQQYGPRQCLMNNIKFENIKRHAIIINRGSNNTFRDLKLINVGANGAGNLGGPAIYPQVYFDPISGKNNLVESVISDRPDDFATSNTSLVYIPEVAGAAYYQSYGELQVTLNQTASYILGFRLPVSTNDQGTPQSSILYTIDYLYNSSSYFFTRKGTLSISADIDNALIQLTDEYDFAGVDSNFTYAPILDFAASFLDYSGNIYTGAPGQVPHSIQITYKNTLNGDYGILTYSYRAIS